MNKVKYNIRLNIQTLKSIFEYFNMNEKNTVIKLITNNKNITEEAKDYIFKTDDNSIYLKNINFGKLYYFLSKNTVFNVYYIKKNDEVIIHTMMDKIHSIEFNDKYDLNKTKEFLKKYKSINYEYLVLFILFVIGLIIFILKRS